MKRKLTPQQTTVLCLLRAGMNPYERSANITPAGRTRTLYNLRDKGLVSGGDITQDGLDAIENVELYGIPCHRVGTD